MVTHSLYSHHPRDRELAKDEYELQGSTAFKDGKKRYDNPHLSRNERSDMKEFAPWAPSMSNNQPAYYWDIGWEVFRTP